MDKCELCEGSGWKTWRNADGYLCGNACICTVKVKDEHGQPQILTHSERQSKVKQYVLEHERSRPKIPQRQWMGWKRVPRLKILVDGVLVDNPDFDPNNPLCWTNVHGVWNDEQIPQEIIDKLWGGE